MRVHLSAVAVAVTVAVVAAGCASTSSGSAPTVPAGAGSSPSGRARVTGRITVSAAASLTTPFQEIGAAFRAANPGADVVFNFDSSATLARQLQDGAAADGFAAADEASMKKVADAGLVAGTPVVFARNRLTIVVKKGNPRGIRGLGDLVAAGTVALCGKDVPCGRYADDVLQRAGVSIPADRITRGQNVKGTLSAVAEGDADAGLVYVSDVQGETVEPVPIPDAQNSIATYPIAVVKTSADPATMQAFITYLLDEPAQAVLRAAGFLPPS